MPEGLADRSRSLMPTEVPLAHSASEPGGSAQTYQAHIAGTAFSDGVVNGTRRRAREMLRFHQDAKAGAVEEIIADAATFHDLGKLDPDIQAAFRRGRNAKLRWDHIDAGVAHLRAHGASMAAWIVRAHHAPGFPSLPAHFASKHYRQLRGCRHDEIAAEKHREQIDRTDQILSDLIETHNSVIACRQPMPAKAVHGLSMRLALSCLVDADYSDTAYADTRWTPPDLPAPRWLERLSALDAYVDRLGDDDSEQNKLRRSFYDACRNRKPDEMLTACEGPVGVGKTTAVTAYLLRRAIATNARRLFIVAPYTAILSQTAQRLREALVLPDERAQSDLIVAEHHHRAEFSDIASRDLATLWAAPIILTTAVQFFETLSSNLPSELRKLHALPGAVIFLDEAHAALPTHLWPQNWRWIRELSEKWTCSFVLASGSLARFWEVEDIVGDALSTLPDLVPPSLVMPLRQLEARRVRYESLGRLDDPRALIDVASNAPGPRLLIMNTVQSAAVMARDMRLQGCDVLHLSTALTPNDRYVVLNEIARRLEPANNYPPNWTLVATSLMEAGIDLSFRTPFRERFSIASLIQIGGRGNRNFEWKNGATVYDFIISSVNGLSAHPAARMTAEIVEHFFGKGLLDGVVDPAALVTRAMRQELRQAHRSAVESLLTAESERRYPDVRRLGRVISADTRLVVIHPDLRTRIEAREKITTRELLSGSVQMWTSKISALGLEPLRSGDEVFWWPFKYDPEFLGYMEGALSLLAIQSGEAIIF